jgi:hypothetical protein
MLVGRSSCRLTLIDSDRHEIYSVAGISYITRLNVSLLSYNNHDLSHVIVYSG